MPSHRPEAESWYPHGDGVATAGSPKDHLAAGLPLSAAPAAARTLHNDLARVAALGVVTRVEPPPGAAVVETRDVDLPALATALAAFEVELPAVVAVAVQDHGDPQILAGGGGNITGGDANRVRFAYLRGLLDRGGDLAEMVFRQPPPGMTRMAAVRETVPGVYLMDTGAAAVLGTLGDPAVAPGQQLDPRLGPRRPLVDPAVVRWLPGPSSPAIGPRGMGGHRAPPRRMRAPLGSTCTRRAESLPVRVRTTG